MIAFRLNNEFIDLNDNTALSIEGLSPLFSADAIPGTRIYTFNARKTRKNQRLFNFSEKIAVKSTVSFPEVDLYLFNSLWKRGELKLRDANEEGYSLSFHTDAGDLAGKIKGKKLADLDLGSDLVNYESTDNIYPDRKYALFPIKNPDFYGGETNPEYGGYMNYYSDGFAQNTVDNSNCLVPFPFLLYIMNRVAQQLGYYGFTGPWTEEEDIRRLVIYNNYAMDKIGADGINRVSTGQQIDFRNHVPDMEIGKFLIAIKNLFGLAFFINPRTRYIEVVKLKDVLLNYLSPGDRAADRPVSEMSHKASAEYQKTPYENNGFTLSMLSDSADELFKERPATDYSYLSGSGSEKYDAQVGTLYQIDEEDAQQPGRQWSIPHTRQKGSSPEFGKDAINRVSSLRLLFYHGLQQDSQGNRYPKASSEGNYYRLGYSGYNGLYERCWKEWLDMLSDSDQVETAFQWGAYELQNFDFRQKIMRDYSLFFIRSYNLSVSQQSMSSVKVTLQKIRV